MDKETKDKDQESRHQDVDVMISTVDAQTIIDACGSLDDKPQTDRCCNGSCEVCGK